MTEQIGFQVTQSKIAFVLSVITLAGFIWTFVSDDAQAKFRLNAVEERQAKFEVEYLNEKESFRREIQTLSASLNQLTLVLKEVEIVQREQRP